MEQGHLIGLNLIGPAVLRRNRSADRDDGFVVVASLGRGRSEDREEGPVARPGVNRFSSIPDPQCCHVRLPGSLTTRRLAVVPLLPTVLMYGGRRLASFAET